MPETVDKYPVTSGPAQMADTLKDLERRIAALEGSPQRGLNFTSYDTADNMLVAVGVLPDGKHGILVQDLEGRARLKVTAEDGWEQPRWPIPILPSGAQPVSGAPGSALRPVTASGSYVELWRADFYSVGAKVTIDATAVAPGGGLCNWQFLITEVGGTYTEIDSGSTATATIGGTYTIPAACLVSGTDPVGRRMSLRVRAFLSGGGTTADVYLNAAVLNHD